MPQTTELFHLTENMTGSAFDMWVGLTPQGIIVTEDRTGDKMERSRKVLYRMEVFTTDSKTIPDTVIYQDNQVLKDSVVFDWSYAPLSDAKELVEDVFNKAQSCLNGFYKPKFTPNWDEMYVWLANFDVHEAICKQADIWASDEIADVINQHMSDMLPAGTTPDSEVLNRLAGQLRYLETYPITLDSYRKIHKHLASLVQDDVLRTLTKQNLNLLMSHTLNELHESKDVLPSVANIGADKNLPNWISTQQRKAVTTESPLVLVQAGAGVGKSTVILERINYMVDSGIDPKEITVLSFTNAAADHIKDKNPGVTSMTTARMIHDIYSMNYPTHELSSVDTIVNSLDIFFPTDDVAMTFRRRLIEMEKKSAFPGGTTALNAFVEHYQDRVIELLNAIKQTCLELEIILAYQQIATMVEPPHIATKYLIIDEVQDNSVFEFIYTLKYAAKHEASLYLVGK